MTISVTCSKCGKKLSAPDGWAGKKAKCSCGTVIAIHDFLEEVSEEPLKLQPEPEPAAEQAVQKPQTPRTTRTGSTLRSRSSVASRSARGGRSRSGGGTVKCPECEGRAAAKKEFRKSKPLVILGFIAIVLAVGGVIASLAILSASSTVSEGISEATKQVSEEQVNEFSKKLHEMEFPEEIVVKLLNGEALSDFEKEALTPEQRDYLANSEVVNALTQAGAELAKGMGELGAEASKGLGKILAVILLIPSLIALAVGILLTLCKRVFVCTRCGTVVAGR